MRLIVGGIFAVTRHVQRTIAVIAVAFATALLPAIITADALVFLTLAGIGNHPEIVIGELQVIFFLHPITVQMGIVRQLAVFFEHLRRIAPRPAVYPVELLAATATIWTVVSAAPATTVIATIVVQGRLFLKTPGDRFAVPTGVPNDV